jgi:hypothetical protein
MLPAGGTLIFTGATASLRARHPTPRSRRQRPRCAAWRGVAWRGVADGMAREFGSRELHVGHVIVDGVIDGATQAASDSRN